MNMAYPLFFYTNLSSLIFLTALFHYPLQYVRIERVYFERYSVNLMRSVACFMIFSQALQTLFDQNFTYNCISYTESEHDLFYFFLAYIYYDTVVLIYQHYLGLEKKIRYDLLLHHVLAIFASTFIEKNGLYALTPYICLSEGISVVSGVKLLANVFRRNDMAKYCIQYRMAFLLYGRMMLLWPYVLYLFYSHVNMDGKCDPQVYNMENFGYMMISICMIYSAEYLWYIRGKSELKGIRSGIRSE